MNSLQTFSNISYHPTENISSEQCYLPAQTSSVNNRSSRHSTSSNSSKSEKHTKQGLSKRQSLPTTIQERVAHGERYKTEMCKQFQLYNSCRYDNKCQYAHGDSELRSINRHPKYKTELCRTYHTTGLCPYGARCHFVHDKGPRSTTDESNKKRKISTSPINAQDNKTNIVHQQLTLQHSYPQSFLSEQQKLKNMEQIQLQMIQFHLLQQQQQQQQQHQQIDELLKSALHVVHNSASSSGSRSPIDSDSNRSSPSYQQHPFNIYYPCPDVSFNQGIPFKPFYPTILHATNA